MYFYIKVVNLESYLVSDHCIIGTFVKNYFMILLDVLFIVKSGDIKIY